MKTSAPDLIVTASSSCQTHQNGAGRTPVRRWIRLVDTLLVD
ncbi:hypothetical protein [Burkholderia ubonensis]